MFRRENMEGKRKRDEEACTKRTLEVYDPESSRNLPPLPYM
ncbi:hypothetical protein HanHA89_Chr17g0693321 [Helianthus annuus]|nr:hypothetical protein HanHA89_Chr17g0693321 [Helianthus annuus]